MYFCTKNKVAVVVVVVVIVVKRTGAGRCTGFEGGGRKEHEVRVLKGSEVQVLNNLKSKRGLRKEGKKKRAESGNARYKRWARFGSPASPPPRY